MTRCDRLAFLLSFCAFGAALIFGALVFENIPHVEDEYTYIWQAQAIASGKAILPSPPFAESFIVPFVIDHNGLRFGKYPLGYPVVLSFGLRLGVRNLVNPLLAGFSFWLMYLLIKKVLDEKTALLASGLTISSPFFLMNSSNLLSHAWSLLLSIGLALAWLDTFALQARRPWLTVCVTAICLGGLALTRPLTAVAVGLPFGIHGLLLLRRGQRKTRLRVLAIGAFVFSISSIHFLWQWALTGDPLLNPYTLWWSKDTLGFGEQIGYQSSGYHLGDAFINLAISLGAGANDLFGWPGLSWLFLPFGLFAVRRNPRALLVSAVFLSLVMVYMLYWSGSWIYGPRYFYEGLFSLTLLSAAGIRWLAGCTVESLAGKPQSASSRRRLMLTGGLVALLCAANLLSYLPIRAAGLHGLYGVSRSDLELFRTPQALAATPRLVVVSVKNWNKYYVLLELGDASLTGPYLIAYSHGEQYDAALAKHFWNRSVLYYDTNTPGMIYTQPR